MARANDEEPELDYSRFAADDPEEATKIEKQGGNQPWQEAKPPNKLILSLITLLAVLIVGGMIVALLMMPKYPKEAMLISLPIEEYDPSWQVNPWASDDSKLLADCFQRGQDAGDGLATVAREFQDATKIRQLLRSIAGEKSDISLYKGDLSKRPMVLHITALGTTFNNIPYIVPRDGNRSDIVTVDSNGIVQNWIPVEEVLNAMKKCPVRHRLLLLDISHPSHDAFLGPLRNDVSTKLDELLKRWEKDKKLDFPVIVSTGPNQFSWPSDPDECSGFAYYIADGLRGKADGYNDTRATDSQVSVRELAKFTTNRVARWAGSVHGANQIPTSYGLDSPAARFVLTLKGLTAANPPPQREGYPEVMEQWWGVRQFPRDRPMDYPLRVGRLTGALLRSEEYWLRSSQTALDRGLTIRKIAGDYWRTKIPSGTALTDPYAKRTQELLTLLQEYRLPAPAADRKETTDPYLTAIISGNDKPEELEKLKAAWDEKCQKTPTVAARLLWDQGRSYNRWNKTTQATWGQLAHQLTNPLTQEGYTRFELILFKRLGEWDIRRKRGIESYPAREVRLILTAEETLSQLLNLGPEGFSLVENQLQETELIRRQAYQSYFDKVTAPLRIEAELQDLTKRYTEVDNSLKEWRLANAKLRELLLAIHDLMPGVMVMIQPNFKDWQQAVELAIEFQDAMAEARTLRRINRVRLNELLRRADETLATLPLNLTEEEVRKKLKDSAPRDEPKKIQEILRLVVNTSGHYKTRKLVWEESRNDYAKVVENLRNRDRTDDENKEITKLENQDLDAAESDVLVMSRVQVVEQMVRLAGASDLESFLPNVVVARNRPGSTDTVEKFAKASQLMWFRNLHDQIEGHIAAERFEQALRILRALPANVLRSPNAGIWYDQPNPLDRLIELDAEAYRKFLIKLVEHDRSIRGSDQTADVESDPFFANRLADLTRAGVR